jgi:hypothetical protein
MEDGVLLTPTLVVLTPPPPRQVVGDLSDHERVYDIIRPRAG